MPHNIYQAADGTHAFASARKPAWHRLGTVFQADAITAQEALTGAGLAGWNIRKVPAMALLDDGTVIEVPAKWAIIRDDPTSGGVLANGGVVGNQWTPYQNEETIAFLQALADESGACIQTAGALGEFGQEVFVTMLLPKGILVGGRDRVNMYLSAFTAHDGTRSLRATVSPVRVVCANTQTANFAQAVSEFRHPHTTGIHDAVELAKTDLALSAKYIEAFSARADALLAAPMSDSEWDTYLTEALVGPRPVLGERTETGGKVTARAIEKWEAEFGSLRHLFREADTQAEIRNTRWAAYQAFTEYLDWEAPVAKNAGDPDLVRARRTITAGDNADMKAAVFDELLAGV